MFDAQLLLSTGTNYSVYGPWMSRGGDNVTYGIDMVKQTMSAGSFDIQLVTKAAEDAGDGTPITSPASTIVYEYDETLVRLLLEVSGGMKELVRYKFTFTGVTTADQWVLFRMLPPSWFDSVDTV